ncbi:hypothetical protein A1O7_06361 [Cladophialophora yegresii CBS 114405]|uniref:Transcription factor domain-containing protein n=1 Tax=Cladophialophora yegresii CBS 114405 TaxID=1182544 RepID=W9W1S2_9EURO|nr:uncharacterized protein A1O7_06361 [Cladophialophora yegresii CBS 114405]EXJ58930.1 hypothetical protein A1O7_06361 [Cladophialophora yegresii CBS 114405]
MSRNRPRAAATAIPQSPLPLARADLSLSQPDMVYFQHFDRQVRAALPASLHSFNLQARDCAFLQYSILCLAASNLSTLDACLTQRNLVGDARRSTASPSPNILHSYHAQQYCELATGQEQSHEPQDTSLILIGKVLLAYYQHASTDHFRFRLAVLETAEFVRRHRHDITRSPTGDIALQLWYRLRTSHRPAEWLELAAGNDESGSGKKHFASTSEDEDIYLACIVGLSPDDLLHDIMLKAMELRRRMVFYHCTAAVQNGSERLPVHVTESSSIAPSHLLALLDIQRRRLEVWKSRVAAEKAGSGCHATAAGITSPNLSVFKLMDHRHRMNHLSCLLCRLIFTRATAYEGAAVDQDLNSAILHEVVDTIDGIDPTISNLVDVYGYSLSEILLQLSYNMPSATYFDYILDVVWPRLEVCGRGYENSHLPTHLAKRIIALMAEEWQCSRRILLVVLAASPNTPKAVLYDIHHCFDVLLYGYDLEQGAFFVNKVSLP